MLFNQFEHPPEQNCLIYVLDPMCSWCWAFAPVINSLKEKLPAELPCYSLLGGLAADSSEPMPASQARQIEQIWHQIEARTGSRFNYRFWTENTPRRSTYPACRAVIAAGRTEPRFADQMIAAIQQAYYLDARNPSDDSTLIELAAGLGLERGRFESELNSSETRRLFQQQLHYKERLGIQGFPSLLLWRDGEYSMLSHGYCDEDTLCRRLSELKVRI